MHVRWLATLSWPEFRHHPWRSLTAVIAIALGVALAFAVQVINASALAEFGQAVRTTQAQADLVLHSRQGPLPDTLLAQLVRHPEVATAQPVLTAEVRLQDAQGRWQPLRLIGLDALSVADTAPDLLPRRLAEANGATAPADAAPARQAATREASAAASPRSDDAAADASRGWQDWFAPDTVYLNAAALRLLSPSARTGTRVLVDLSMGYAHASDQLINETASYSPSSSSSQHPLRLAGRLAAGGPPTAVMDVAAAQALLGRQGELSRVDLKLHRSLSPEQAQRVLALPASVWLSRPQDATARTASLTRAYRVNLSVMALVALFTGAFLVYSVLALSVAQRAPQLALLGVLGWSPRERQRLILHEALVLGGLGAALGLALGYLLGWGAMQLLGGDLGGGYFAGQAPQLLVSWPAAALYGGLGVLATVAGAWLPARQAAALPPAHTLKGAGVADAQPLPLVWGLGLLALAAALAGLPAVNGVPVAAYASVGLLLLGGMALLPLAVATAYDRLAPWVRRAALPLLAVERARRLRALAAVAVSGVVAALALSTALTVMVASFRASMLSWLDTVLPAELYVRMPTRDPDAGQASPGRAEPLPAGLLSALAALPGLTATPQRSEPWPLDPTQPALTLIWRDLSAGAAQSLPLVSGPADSGANGSAEYPRIYISEQVRDQQQLAVGQVWPALARFLQTDGRYTVAGVYRDYARPGGSVTLDWRDLQARGAPQAPTDIAVRRRDPDLSPEQALRLVRDQVRAHAAPPSRHTPTNAVAEPRPPSAGDGASDARHAASDSAGDRDAASEADTRIRAQTAPRAGPQPATAGTAAAPAPQAALPEVHSTAALRARSMAIFDRSFAVTYWLQMIAVGIGLFGVSASFSAQALARRKEFGLLVHLGLTRAQIRRLVALEGMAWCTIGAVAGVALGLAVALVLIKVVNPQSFHWSMDLHVPLLRLLALGLAVVLAGTVTAWLTARRVAGGDAVRAVQEDW
ncbi:ABC transporter permease [Comamonas serinivorans]|nr:ABC transporter permease [Comamonas serinivorans]